MNGDTGAEVPVFYYDEDLDGAASEKFVKQQDVYYVKEVVVPDGYRDDGKVWEVKPDYGSFDTVEMTNTPIRCDVSVDKKDKETSDPQGDARLSGATYGLYALETVNYPDGRGIVSYAGNDNITSTAGTDFYSTGTPANTGALDSISEQLSALSQNAELIEKVSKKLEEMPKVESADEESIRKEYEEKLEQKEAELSIQQDQLNKLMKTKAELTRKLEQMQEENQSVSKLRESMDQEMDEYRKQKNQILDERDDALRESRNLRKEMEEMKRTIGELEKQIQERDSRELERQLLNQTYQTQSVEDVERTVPVNEGVAEEKKKTPGWQAGYQAVVPNRYGGTQIVQIEHIRKKGPEHLLALAGKKCFRSKAKYNLIQQMKEADLSKSQMEQIQVAIESGLTDTEVSDIINSGFDVEEMAQAIQILLADKMYQ